MGDSEWISQVLGGGEDIKDVEIEFACSHLDESEDGVRRKGTCRSEPVSYA